jgi:hypothetical protein
MYQISFSDCRGATTTHTHAHKAVNESDDIKGKKAVGNCRIEIRLVILTIRQNDFSVYIDKCSPCLYVDVYIYPSIYICIYGDCSA